MDTAFLMEIENLRRATLADLRSKFSELFQEPTRSRHREHLFRRIAWRLQALAEGDLTERLSEGRRKSPEMPTCEKSRHGISCRWTVSPFKRHRVAVTVVKRTAVSLCQG
jgi:hypothetical protein